MNKESKRFDDIDNLLYPEIQSPPQYRYSGIYTSGYMPNQPVNQSYFGTTVMPGQTNPPNYYDRK